MDISKSAIKQRLRTYMSVIIAAVFLLLFGIYAGYVNSENQERELRASVAEKLAVIRARLEGSIIGHAHLVKGLVAAITIDSNMSQERFNSLASPLFSRHSYLRNIGFAPGLVIRFIYPVEGNRKAIGIDYRKLPGQYAAVKKAIDEQKLILAGPINLVQGGRGFIARIPVYENDKAGGKRVLRGIISAVIDADKLYRAGGLLDSELKIDIALREKTANGGSGEVFFGNSEIFQSAPVYIDVTLPGRTWELAAIPQGGWSENVANRVLFWLSFLVAALAILTPLYLLSLSLERKRESQMLLEGLFELSPVGIALNDFDTGDFIDVNAALLQPSGYSRDEFLRLSYWDVTPVKYKEEEARQLDMLNKTGRYGPYRKEYIRKDGSHYPVILKGMMVTSGNGEKRIWSIVEDVSDRPGSAG